MKKNILNFSFPIFCCLILLLLDSGLTNAQKPPCDKGNGGNQGGNKPGYACEQCYIPPVTSYVYISTSEGIQVRTPIGNLIQTLTTGYGNELTGLSIDAEGRLLVSDLLSNTVSAFDNHGSLTGTFGSGFNLPGAIVIDNMSNVFVSELNGNEIRKFDYNGNFKPFVPTLQI